MQNDSMFQGLRYLGPRSRVGLEHREPVEVKDVDQVADVILAHHGADGGL